MTTDQPPPPLQQLENEAAEQAAHDPAAERKEDLLSRVHSFAELAAVETVASEPLLGPIIRRKWRTIILGHTGEGKSSLTTRMVGALVTGTPCLGYEATKCRVLVIDVEQDESIAQERVGEAMLGPLYDGDTVAEVMASIPEAHDAWYCRWTEGLALDEQSIDREVLREVIDDKRPDVVVVDPLYKCFLGNPNEAQLAAQVMRFLDSLREAYGFALVVPMHPRKEQQGATGRRLTKHDAYGGATWIWGAEMILGIQRMPQSEAELIFFKDRSSTVEPDTRWHLRYSPEEGFVRMRESVPGGPTVTEDLILGFLAKHPDEWFDRANITKAISTRSERAISLALTELAKQKSAGKQTRLEIKPGRANKKSYRWRAPVTDIEVAQDFEQIQMGLEVSSGEDPETAAD